MIQDSIFALLYLLDSSYVVNLDLKLVIFVTQTLIKSLFCHFRLHQLVIDWYSLPPNE